MFVLDPRIQKQSKVAQSKIYKTNNQFSALATNEMGNIAVASNNGDIRLYTDVDKNARNRFKGW